MQLAQKYLRLFVRYLLVAVPMVSAMPVLSLFTGPALAGIDASHSSGTIPAGSNASVTLTITGIDVAERPIRYNI